MSPGSELIRLHSRAIMIPVSMVTGIRFLWLFVPNTKRARCGTANPINEIGPQNAVVVATRTPVDSSNKVRVRIMFIPKFCA